MPVRVARHVTPLLDSLVVSLTDLAGELAGAELWRDHEPATDAQVATARLGALPRHRDFAGEYRARVERMAARL